MKINHTAIAGLTLCLISGPLAGEIRFLPLNNHRPLASQVRLIAMVEGSRVIWRKPAVHTPAVSNRGYKRPPTSRTQNTWEIGAGAVLGGAGLAGLANVPRLFGRTLDSGPQRSVTAALGIAGAIGGLAGSWAYGELDKESRPGWQKWGGAISAGAIPPALILGTFARLTDYRAVKKWANVPKALGVGSVIGAIGGLIGAGTVAAIRHFQSQ